MSNFSWLKAFFRMDQIYLISRTKTPIYNFHIGKHSFVGVKNRIKNQSPSGHIYYDKKNKIFKKKTKKSDSILVKSSHFSSQKIIRHTK